MRYRDKRYRSIFLWNMVFILSGTCTFNKAKVFKVIYMHVLGASIPRVIVIIIIIISVCRFCFVGNKRIPVKRPFQKWLSKLVTTIS